MQRVPPLSLSVATGGEPPDSSTFSSALSIPFEHPVTSLSISPLGKMAVLAAKRGLYIINLEKPFEAPRILHHLSKWDVADCAWNPHISRQEWIVTTSNTKALIWNVHRESLSSKSHVEFVLNKHLRAISDIHWSPFSPELVATCSYDAYIHCWDLRSSPEKPSISFCGWNAGATQVKFNRINEYLLASSHDTDIRVWDTRKGSSPTTLITAHRTKIYGLDWSLSKEDELLTCSQDTLVKIWNIKTPRNCLFTIETSSPCWRARYTPFGNSILTMPQRKDNSLYLWNLDRPEAPAYTFAGHVDTPTEFVWRYQGKNESTAANGDFSQEYQLVTWSKDMHLRLWPIGKEIAASAGVVIADDTETPRSAGMLHSSSSPRNIKPRRNYSDTQLHGASSGSDSIADYESYPDSSSNNSMKTALSRSRDSASDEESIVLDNDLVEIEKELDNVQSLFPSIYIDRTNLGSRRCTIRLERIDPSAIATSKQANKQILFQVNITFPKGYPKVPVFCDIQRNWSISMMNRNFLSRKLGLISGNFAKRGKCCLEFIVKYLLGGNANADSTDSLNKSISPLSVPLLHKSEKPVVTTAADDHVGFDSDSDSSGIDEILLPPKAFTADRAPAAPVDESDDSFSDDSGGGRVGAIGIGGMAMGRHMDSANHEKGSNTVPFPRLCSAVFSPTGQLIYFFSPLPHPSNTKFTAYTLTTRNQQPILQSQNFSTQPKTYQLYESYRNFVLSKVPKNPRFLGVSSNIADLIPAKEGNLARDRKLDYWLDDEDMEDDNLSLYWRPKPTTTLQPQSLQTTDFLAKLVSFRQQSNPISMAVPKTRSESPGVGSGNIKDHPIHSTLSVFAGNLLQNHRGGPGSTTVVSKISSASMSDVSPATFDVLGGLPIKYPSGTNQHFRRRSGSVVQDNHRLNSSWGDLGIPFRHKASISPGQMGGGLPDVNSLDLMVTASMENLIASRHSIAGIGVDSRRLGHKKGKSEGEPLKNIGPGGLLIESGLSSNLNEPSTNSDCTFGTIIFTANLDFLCGPNQHLANNYKLVGSESKKALCTHNMNACITMERPDLAHFWKVAELLCSEEEGGFGTPSEGPFSRDNNVAVLENILQELETRKDMQTLATLLCVCLGATSPDISTTLQREPKSTRSSYFTPDFLTSSPALSFVNDNLKVVPPLEEKRLKSRLCKSLSTPFTTKRPNHYTHSFRIISEDTRKHIFPSSVTSPTPFLPAKSAVKTNTTFPLSSSSSFSASIVGSKEGIGRDHVDGDRVMYLLSLYRPWIASYSAFLYNCGLFEKRLQLLNATGYKAAAFWLGEAALISPSHPTSAKSATTEMTLVECLCPNPPNNLPCLKCRTKALQCTYCRCITRGLSAYCILCGHGGHLDCMRSAYDTTDRNTALKCLVGCGCSCVFVPR